MKNTLKKGLLVILVVLISLCCVSCFDDDKPFVPYDEIQTQEFDDGVTKSISYFYAPSSGDWLQFHIQNCSTIISLSYSSESGSAQFDTIGIKDAPVPLVKEEGQNHARTPYSSSEDEVNLSTIMGTYLPDTATWTLEFKCSADPSKDLIREIPSDKVTTIKAWIEANK